MRWPLVVVFVFGGVLPALGQDPLPSRPLGQQPFTVAGPEPASFDLVDVREDLRQLAAMKVPDVEPHSHFEIKKHIGASAGFEGNIVHGSAGIYFTLAEWGRWNFGAPTVELGLGRYPFYDARRKQDDMGSAWTVMVSVASVHYRLGWIQSLGVNWYLHFEQVVDLHTNIAGSQFGFSFSRK
jgi:hypothetical protein